MDSTSDLASDFASEREEDSGIDSNADSGDGHVYIRVSVPELKLQVNHWDLYVRDMCDLCMTELIM